MKIAIGQIFHETNSFSSEPTTEHSFKQHSWCEGAELIEQHTGVRSYIGGMIDEAKQIGNIEVIPTFGVSAAPSGLIKKATWENIKSKLINALKAAQPFDAICLDLHGAGIAETSNDIEGDILQEIRNEFGLEIPLLATLDLHSNVTDKMVNNSDLLLGVNFYPHTDCYERGRELIQYLREMINGTIQPTMKLVKLPMIMPTTTTIYGPAHDINKKCWEWEEKTGILDCTFFHGFPYTDSPEIGISVLAISDNNPELAFYAANSVAHEIWARKEDFQVSLPTAAEGLELALSSQEMPVVINETSDNPGAGAPGDGTYLLDSLLKRNESKTCFAHICDSEVVNIAVKAGVGKEVTIQIGGKKDDRHGDPLNVVATVEKIVDCKFTYTNQMCKGQKVDLGIGILLKIGKVDVIVTEIKSQLLDDELLKLFSIDMNEYKVIAIKSSQHFRAFFQTAVPKIITIDSPGISTFDFSTFNYQSGAKEKFPLNINKAEKISV